MKSHPRTLSSVILASALIVAVVASSTRATLSWPSSPYGFFGDAGQAGGNGQGTGTGTGQAGGTGTGQTGGNGQGGGTGSGQAGGSETAPPPVPEGSDVKGKLTSNEEKPLVRFGDEFFAAARASILAARQKPTVDQGTNAFAGPAGPTSLGSVYGTPPETYQLGPGDKLTVRVTTPFRDPVEAKVVVDTFGSIVVPTTGQKLTVRGQTMNQAEGLLTKEITRFLKEPTVTIVLDELRTFSVSVLGESFAPGVYQVPATFSFFNLILATGGPSERGTLRSIQLRRNNSPGRTFDLYKFLITGDSKQDLQLQPGDVIFYGVSRGEASIEGEVNRPGAFELSGSETLTSLLSFAGGIRPSGVAQNVSIDSVVPGSERRLLNIDLEKMTPAKDPQIRSGDKVSIFSIRPLVRNAVTITGPVEQPRVYAYKEGMTVKDLVQLALGLRPEAEKSIAEIRRLQSDGTYSLTRLNLQEALSGNPKSNLVLVPDDTLKVFDVNDLNWTGDRKVSILGAVREPGEKYRADGMRVGDLIREGRGLTLEAYSQEAHLQRFTKDGTPDVLVKIDLMKAALGDPAHDVVLLDRDQLRVYKISEWQAIPELIATVQGSVQRPGNYPLAKGLKVKDLVELAGGLALDAYKEKAFLQKINTDGTIGPIQVIDLNKALSSDPEHNVVLGSRDRLNVLNVVQAQFKVEQTVTIRGGVQRPGSYPASSNLTLKDLIDLAGGLLPDASGMVEVSSAWRPLGEGISEVRLSGELGAYQVPTVQLVPGNVVSVFQRSDVLARPRIVTVLGAVNQPGAYVITKEGERISDVIKRAGGVRSEAFPKASEFIRDPKFLVTGQQRNVTPQILEALQKVAQDEYKRAQALLDLDRLRLVFSNGASVGGGSINVPIVSGGSQEGLQPGTAMDQALAKTLTSEGVTVARALNEKDVLPVGNLNSRIDQAIARPNGKDDLQLMDGDVIIIPLKPTSITITGAVMAPSSVLFEPGASMEYYLSRAGGVTRDSDKETLLIIRATGELVRYRKGVRMEVGDTILVPTKTQGTRFKDDRPAIQSAIQGLTSAATTLAILRAIR